MEIPNLPTKKQRLKHTLTTLALLSGLAALPASFQTSSGETNAQPPMPPLWSILEDADQDGMTDADELLWGMDPLNPEDGLSDLDGDKISLAWEFAIGTNSSVADTDLDGWSDAEEYLLYGTDPLDFLSYPQSGAPDNGGNAALESAIPEPEPEPEPPPPPTLSNGDFSDVSITTWKTGMLNSTHYQGGGFKWAYAAKNAVTDWSAYVGSTVEVWEAGGERFVELDASSGNYGIKQAIANPKAGGHVLAWRESGRSCTRAGSDPYRVKVYYLNGTTEVPIAESREFKDLNKSQWTDNAFVFQITPEQIKSANNIIYVAFIPSGSSLNTYGTLIDKVSLLTVEILDRYELTANKLKVAKMSDTGVLENNQGAATLDIDNDLDRFFVGIQGGAILGPASVKVSTEENPNSAYNDDETEVDLQVANNDLITKSMILVSDDVDDDYPVDGIADDPKTKNERTHKIQLGGKFCVKSLTFRGQTHSWDVKVPTPYRKKLAGRIVLVGSASDDAAAVAKLRDIAVVRYAQTGVKLEVYITTMALPPGVNETNVHHYGGIESTPKGGGNLVHDDMIKIIEKAEAEKKRGNITVFIVKDMEGLEGGKAYTKRYTAPVHQKYTCVAVISAKDVLHGNSVYNFTIPHEIGHILTNEGHYPYGSSTDTELSIKHNLMRDGTSGSNTIFASKRFIPDQADKFLPELLSN